MSTEAKRHNPFVGVLFLLVAIAVGAHLSALPLFIVKVSVATVLVGVYAFFAVRILSALRIRATGPRAVLGLLLGAGIVYLTWAVRLPAFSGWETPITFDPGALYSAVVDRAGNMEISKGFGAGTTAEGPSWLLLGTYLIEAAAFTGVVFLGALLSGPDEPESASHEAAPDEAGDASTQNAA